MVNRYYIINLLLILAVKEFLNRYNICQSYHKSNQKLIVEAEKCI